MTSQSDRNKRLRKEATQGSEGVVEFVARSCDVFDTWQQEVNQDSSITWVKSEAAKLAKAFVKDIANGNVRYNRHAEDERAEPDP